MEIAAVILAIAYLVLAIRENRWCWPAGVASALLYLGVFYAAGLYMEAWLQLFYAAMGIYGWWAWRPGADGTRAAHHPPLAAAPARRRARGDRAVVPREWRTAGALHGRGQSPYLDSFVTWSAVLTTWMVARKLLENWLYWFVIDAVTLGARAGARAATRRPRCSRSTWCSW